MPNARGRRRVSRQPDSRSGQALSRRDFVDAGVLRSVVGAIRALADDLARDVAQSFDVAKDADIDISIHVSVPSAQATIVSEALGTLDFAWRLGAVIASGNRVLIGAPRYVRLDAWMLPESHGLTIIETSAGSFEVDLKRSGAKLGQFLSLLAVATSLSGFSARDIGSVIESQGTRSNGTPCKLRLSGQLSTPLQSVMQREFGKKMPPNCKVAFDVRTPDALVSK